MEKDGLGGREPRGKLHYFLKMLHWARAHTPLPRLQPSASSSRHQITLHPSLGWVAWSDSPAQGELAPSPKPFQNESTLVEAAAPPSPPAAPALPARLTPARSSFPERAPRGRRPPPSGGRWVASRAAGLRAGDSCPAPPLRWPPSDRGWGALGPAGGLPAAVRETRARGGGQARRPHRPLSRARDRC